LILLLDHSSQA
jgi:hypothetical protein